jgi:hypothetical protein
MILRDNRGSQSGYHNNHSLKTIKLIFFSNLVISLLIMNKFGTITITFGDQAENHVGMQKLGKGLAPAGFTVKELENAKVLFEKAGCKCELINLNKNLPVGASASSASASSVKADEAAILVIKDAVNMLLKPLSGTDKDMATELTSLEWDKKAKMYGRVVNKRARYNLCFDDNEQQPDIAAGMGRVIDFEDIPYTKFIRISLSHYLGPKADGLVAEGNWYYDTSICSIGAHGDTERLIVIAVRLGECIPLYYQWYLQGNEVGNRETINVGGGDMYVMSQKAVGNDWKKRKTYTLRHAAGKESLLFK